MRAHLLPGAALTAHDLVGTFMLHAVLPVVCCMARWTLLAQELDAESRMAAWPICEIELGSAQARRACCECVRASEPARVSVRARALVYACACACREW